MRRFPLILGAAALASAAMLGGCTGSTDPHRAGFLDSVGNLASGTYDQRQAGLQQQRAATEAQAQQMAARANELEQQRVALAAEENQARARLQSVNAQLYRDQQRLAALRQRQGVDQARLSQLQARLIRAQQQRNQIAANPASPQQDQEMARLEREVQDLQGVIDQMIANVATPQ